MEKPETFRWQGFEWDADKAQKNIVKHGVSFETASTVFDDALSMTIRDPEHSYDEERFVTVGTSNTYALLLVCHCDRGDVIRIISARPVEPNERRYYQTRTDD